MDAEKKQWRRIRRFVYRYYARRPLPVAVRFGWMLFTYGAWFNFFGCDARLISRSLVPAKIAREVEFWGWVSAAVIATVPAGVAFWWLSRPALDTTPTQEP